MLSKKTKYIALIFLIIASYLRVSAQLTNTGTYIHIPALTYVNAQCAVINDNDGLNTGTINNDGVLITTGHLTNNGQFNSGNQSSVRLEGAIQNLTGIQPYSFNTLVIDGSDNKNLNAEIQIAQALVFNANKILINNNNLILLPAANITTPTYQKFVVTNGTGTLVKKSLPTGSGFLFPVGDATGSYKPVVINTAGAVDTFAVRVINGVTPTDQTSVQKTYIIKESTPSATTASVTLGWNTVDEGTAFQSAQALMWQQLTGTWTSINTTPAGAVPNSPSTDWKYTADSVQFLSMAADSFILKSAAPPVINTHPQNQSVCETGNVSFSVSATGLGTLSYQWQVNCSGSWNNISNGGTLPTYSGATDSTLNITNVPYTHNGCQFRCVVMNVAGTSISNAATLLVYAAPYVTITGDTALCEGDSTVLHAQTVATLYLWSTAEITQNITASPLIDQNYSVTVTDVNGCTSSVSTSVQVTPVFTVSITSDYAPDNVILQGQVMTFTASPSGYDSYTFYINNTSVQNSTSNTFITANLLNGDTVTVTGFVNECTDSDSLLIKIKPIANAFTPFDKDNKNDIFAKGVDLVIFNRWGQVIYEGTDGWDGTFNGKNVSYGTYFYIMKLNATTDTPTTLTGIVTLLSKNN